MAGDRGSRGAGPRPAAGIARGAALIVGLTVISRVLGLVRTLVFSQTAVLAAACATLAFGAVAYLLDDGDLRAIAARLRLLARLRS